MRRCRSRCCSARWARRCATRSTRSRSTAIARPTTLSCCWPTAKAAPQSTRRCIRNSFAVFAVCLELALGIVRGGEGATKLVTVTVTGAASPEEARRAAKAIANSPLVKTAIHGGDPNWGRLIAVAGRAGVAFELSRAAVRIGSIVLFKDGRPYDEAAPQAAEYLKAKELTVSVDLGAGAATSTVWTCDL